MNGFVHYKWVHWNEDVTGRRVFNISPRVSLHPMNWAREGIIFFTEHRPFQSTSKDLDSHATTSAHAEVLKHHSTMPQSAFSPSSTKSNTRMSY
ncbi:hypothetical protein AVEN_155812-1 [Araneus ventricosus]|uniref:Uncharacterized protein n=1 Tax=Araneus ventricosus TaxID=182803 RepID=A0A4Y2G5R3_ARAVE|nr:hypothetical protein AVEN_155812-1 [Araneus ventricosus]